MFIALSASGLSAPLDLAKWHTARGSLKFLWFSMLMGLSLWGKT